MNHFQKALKNIMVNFDDRERSMKIILKTRAEELLRNDMNDEEIIRALEIEEKRYMGNDEKEKE